LGKEQRIILAGGDRRFQILAQLLAAEGFQVRVLGQEAGWTAEDQSHDADCVILPIPPEDGAGQVPTPLSGQRIGLETVLAGLGEGQLVCAGGKSPRLEELQRLQGFRLVDYIHKPELAVENAVPTAEGAIRIAMEELPCTLFGTETLVIGYGNCGYALAERLRSLGAKVTVSARSQRDLARIRCGGMRAVETGNLLPVLSTTRLVFNTVPALVLREEELSALPRNGLVIDLASKPGGVDWTAAQKLGVKAIHALGLPGKCAPESAAQALKRVILPELLATRKVMPL
jgi:dipicolinate synthase subunit A